MFVHGKWVWITGGLCGLGRPLLVFIYPEPQSGQPKVAATPRRHRVKATPPSHFPRERHHRRYNWRRGRRLHLSATRRRSYTPASSGIRVYFTHCKFRLSVKALTVASAGLIPV
jgi:hypothetical protein